MTTTDDCNPSTCPHGMTIQRFDPDDGGAPLPPFCQCCGQPITLGTSFCNVCTTVIPT